MRTAMPRRFGLVLLVIALPLVARPHAQISPPFTPIDVPFAGPVTGTFPEDVNDRGQIVGTYLEELDFVRGFLYDRGVFTRLDALPPRTGTTSPRALNNRGQIVGTYTVGFLPFEAATHGFLYEDGAFTDFNVPGALRTFPNAINDHGQIVGTALFDDFPFDSRGFIYDNGVLNEIHIPGSLSTSPFGINNRGQIIGTVRFPNDPVFYWFLFERGEFQIFEGFVLIGINDRGQLLVSTRQTPLSYFLYEDGVFSPITVPVPARARVRAINTRGQIVGFVAGGYVFAADGTLTWQNPVGFVGTPPKH